MSFAIRKDTYFTEVAPHFSAVKCRCGVSFLLLALLCTWHTFHLLLCFGRKNCLSGIGSINVDFRAVVVIGKIDIFSLLFFSPFFFLLLILSLQLSLGKELSSGSVIVLIFIILAFTQKEWTVSSLAVLHNVVQSTFQKNYI